MDSKISFHLHTFWVTILASAIIAHPSSTDAIVTDASQTYSQIANLGQSSANQEISKNGAPVFSRQKRLLPTDPEISSPNALTNYDFEYQIHGGGNFFGHAEKRTGVETNGEYFVILPDFRRQVVKYYVDRTGYHATVSYEPITSVGNGQTINLLPPSILDRSGGGHSSSQQRRKSYKKIVRKRVPKRRRSSSGSPNSQTKSITPSTQSN